MSILYQDTAEAAPATAPLRGERHGDVVIVGGGLTGLSTALHLAERGLKAIVLEAEELGFGASGRNGGQVNPGLKSDPDTVETDFGVDLGGRMNALAGGAPAFVFELIRRHAIRCEARQQGTLRAAAGHKHALAVRATAAQLQRRGAPVEILERDAAAAATGTSRYRLALLDRRGGDLNPLSFARGLARAALNAGAGIYCGSRALSLKRVASGWQVGTPCGTAFAPHVVIATNGYTDSLWPKLKRSIVPVFGAIAATAPLSQALARHILPTRSVLYESGAITVYYRLDSGNRLLFGGRGPMHEVSSRAEVASLLSYAHTLWPQLRGTEWTHAWGGQLGMTKDHYPHVHQPALGVLVCLGYNGRGVALSTALGAQLARLIAEPAVPMDMPITPIRAIPLHGFWRLGVFAAITRGRLNDALSR